MTSVTGTGTCRPNPRWRLVKAGSTLLWLLAAPAFAEPSYYEAFDFQHCLHRTIDNEMNAAPPTGTATKPYLAALALANRQPYSRHRPLSPEQFERMTRNHPTEIAVVYTAQAQDLKTGKTLEKYGVCNLGEGLRCLPDQDFPLAGAHYRPGRSRGALVTLECFAGCASVPTALHNMGYEAMDGERNLEQATALKRFAKTCGRRP